MRLLCVGDLHLRATIPFSRKAGFLEAQQDKVRYILDLAYSLKAKYILWPGDVFDRSDPPNHIIYQAIRRFQSSAAPHLFVAGQHDLRHHTSKMENSPLGILSLATATRPGSILLENRSPYTPTFGVGVFWGCDWGTPLHEIPNDGRKHIVMLHRPVTKDPVPWEHPDLITARELLKAQPQVSLFVCGDNHTTFVDNLGGRYVVNAGSVMRTSKNQRDHKPCVFSVDIFTEGSTKIEQHFLPIDEDVWEVEEESKTVLDTQMMEFAKVLGLDFDPGLSFLDNLDQASKQLPDGIKRILAEVWEGK